LPSKQKHLRALQNSPGIHDAKGAALLLAFFTQDGLFFAQDDFALAYELVVQPQAVFVGGRLAPRARRTAEQAHASRRLKNVRRKRAAVDIEFYTQIAGVGDPGDLVALINHDDLRDEANEYRAFSHFLLSPHAVVGLILLLLSVHSDDSIFPVKNSCKLPHNGREALVTEI
jgi:hypothetical protein